MKKTPTLSEVHRALNVPPANGANATADMLAMSRYARRGDPFMVYVHPRELDPSAWDLKLPLSPLDQLFHRIGLRSTPRKLRALLAHGSWRTIGDALQSSVQADSNPP